MYFVWKPQTISFTVEFYSRLPDWLPAHFLAVKTRSKNESGKASWAPWSFRQDFAINRAIFSSVQLCEVTRKPRFVPSLCCLRDLWSNISGFLCTAKIPPPCLVKARKAVVKGRWGCNIRKTREKRIELLLRPSVGRKVSFCPHCPVHPRKWGSACFCCVHTSKCSVSVRCFVVEPANPQSSEPLILIFYKSFKKIPLFFNMQERQLLQQIWYFVICSLCAFY